METETINTNFRLLKKDREVYDIIRHLSKKNSFCIKNGFQDKNLNTLINMLINLRETHGQD
jgi:hypothetical protein